jgi:hypothetical protein
LEKLIGAEPREFGGGLSFVTTNYDLNIESMCVSLNSKMNPGFEIHRVEQSNVIVTENCYDARGIPLLKLHGSVNWYPADSDPGLVVEDSIVAIDDFESAERQRSLPYPCASEYKAPDIPVIVPPSFLKPDLPNALKAFWSGAAQALSRANVVAFIGYSFPLSDTEMMFFLGRAFSENAGLRAVYLVDPLAVEIASRLRASGSRIGSHFRDLLRPIPLKWADYALPALLDEWRVNR